MNAELSHIIGRTKNKSPAHIIAQLNESIDANYEIRHEELEQSLALLQCGNENGALERYFKQHMELRSLMIQANCPQIENEKTTVSYIIRGLMNYERFGACVRTIMLSVIPSSIKTCKETILYFVTEEEAADNNMRHSGIPAAQKRESDNLSPEQLNKVANMVSRNFSQHFLITYFGQSSRTTGRQHKGGNSGSGFSNERGGGTNGGRDGAGGRGGHGEARSAQGQHGTESAQPDQENAGHQEKTKDTYIIDSGCQQSIIHFSPPDARRLTTPTTINTTNGPIFATHSGVLTIRTQNNKYKPPFFVCRNTDENMISVVDLAETHGAVLMDRNAAYLVSPKDDKLIRSQILPLEIRDGNAYTIKAHPVLPSIPNSQGQMAFRPVIDTKVKPTQKLVLKLRNPVTNAEVRIESQLPRLGRPPQQSSPDQHRGVPGGNQSNTNADSSLIPSPTAFVPPDQRLPPNDTTEVTEEAARWHRVTNHTPAPALKQMANHPDCIVLGSVSVDLPSKFTCSIGFIANLQRGTHPRTSHAYEREEALSSDSCGPLPCPDLGGERHLVTFIDVATRYAADIPIVSRSEIPHLVEATFSNFIRDYGRAPRMFVLDGAGEYMGQHVQATLVSVNCKHSPTSPYSPEENSIAERLNRTLEEAVHAALHTAELDAAYWPHVLQDAVSKYNMRPHNASGKVPIVEWLRHNSIPKKLGPSDNLAQ